MTDSERNSRSATRDWVVHEREDGSVEGLRHLPKAPSSLTTIETDALDYLLDMERLTARHECLAELLDWLTRRTQGQRKVSPCVIRDELVRRMKP